jgi:hypothetical protein
VPPERVRVYEKIRAGIWSYNGVFHLVDSWREKDEFRNVFKFRLIAVEGDEDFAVRPQGNIQRRRVISSSVKLAVWKRDGGKCTMCGATDELHFDHDLPWSKGERLLPKRMFNFFALGTISENGIGSYKLLILVLVKLSSHRRNNDLVIIDGLRKLGSTKSRSVLPVSRRSRECA